VAIKPIQTSIPHFFSTSNIIIKGTSKYKIYIKAKRAHTGNTKVLKDHHSKQHQNAGKL
jgi:hypothetical protein